MRNLIVYLLRRLYLDDPNLVDKVLLVLFFSMLFLMAGGLFVFKKYHPDLNALHNSHSGPESRTAVH